MAELVTVARPYAKAAYRFASEAKATAEWSVMLGFAAAVMLDKAVAKALDKAFETLASAALLNPTSPEVDYHIASLKAYNKDFAGARAGTGIPVGLGGG